MGLFSSITKGLFGGSDTSQSSPFNNLPTWAQTGFQDANTSLQNIFQNPLDYFGFNLTPYENTLYNQQMNFAPTSNKAGIYENAGLKPLGFTKGAQSAFADAARYMNGAQGYIDAAGRNINAGTSPISAANFNDALNLFMNPFENQVVSNFARDVNQNSAGIASDIAGMATDAGAFGGTRQALLEAENNRNTLNTIGDYSANLRNSGYQSAATNALAKLTGERDRYLQGAGLNLGQADGSISAGGALSALGSSLMGARNSNITGSAGIQNIFNNADSAYYDRMGQRIGAAQALASPQRIAQQAPIQALQLYSQFLQGIPTGATSKSSSSNGLFSIFKPIGGA